MTEQLQPAPKGNTPLFRAPLQAACRDLYQGFLHTTQNSLALIGTVLAVALIVFGARPDLRDNAEQRLLGWLMERQETLASADSDAMAFPAELTAIERVTATEPHALPKAQANVAFWLSRKYRVAPEPLSALVAEAFEIGQRVQLDPTLILAVMAVESRFNPFAQSPVGAQGLMQVMTRVHTDKYEDFGGQLAAFDPVSNLRVGVRVLQDCIKRAGSIEGGLRLYVGAVTTDGSWYIDKVMAEHARIRSVALGKPVSPQAQQVRTVQAVQPAVPKTVPAPRDELEAEVTTPVARPAEALSHS
ncbi:MAG: lytic transglycosylase domain-containing protein [Hydrogenophaga sp.]|nr:lytic transglycosylase domain-containing protein [Hydrogenophaga sp.]